MSCVLGNLWEANLNTCYFFLFPDFTLARRQYEHCSAVYDTLFTSLCFLLTIFLIATLSYLLRFVDILPQCLVDSFSLIHNKINILKMTAYILLNVEIHLIAQIFLTSTGFHHLVILVKKKHMKGILFSKTMLYGFMFKSSPFSSISLANQVAIICVVDMFQHLLGIKTH